MTSAVNGVKKEVNGGQVMLEKDAERPVPVHGGLHPGRIGYDVWQLHG